jgi:hydrogenase nickel incorporation protein HypA/HybF
LLKKGVIEMHEMGIAESILTAMRKDYPGAQVVRTGVRVGERSGVNMDSLQFCWDALMRAEGDRCELDIEFCPRHNQCPECEWVFPLENFRTDCPRCGCKATAPAGGTELELAYFELEKV